MLEAEGISGVKWQVGFKVWAWGRAPVLFNCTMAWSWVLETGVWWVIKHRVRFSGFKSRGFTLVCDCDNENLWLQLQFSVSFGAHSSMCVGVCRHVWLEKAPNGRFLHTVYGQPYLNQSLLHGGPIRDSPGTLEHEIRIGMAFRLAIFRQLLPLV